MYLWLWMIDNMLKWFTEGRNWRKMQGNNRRPNCICRYLPGREALEKWVDTALLCAIHARDTVQAPKSVGTRSLGTLRTRSTLREDVRLNQALMCTERAWDRHYLCRVRLCTQTHAIFVSGHPKASGQGSLWHVVLCSRPCWPCDSARRQTSRELNGIGTPVSCECVGEKSPLCGL